MLQTDNYRTAYGLSNLTDLSCQMYVCVLCGLSLVNLIVEFF